MELNSHLYWVHTLFYGKHKNCQLIQYRCIHGSWSSIFNKWNIFWISTISNAHHSTNMWITLQVDYVLYMSLSFSSKKIKLYSHGDHKKCIAIACNKFVRMLFFVLALITFSHVFIYGKTGITCEVFSIPRGIEII